MHRSSRKRVESYVRGTWFEKMLRGSIREEMHAPLGSQTMVDYAAVNLMI